jgi:hypothetical protein
MNGEIAIISNCDIGNDASLHYCAIRSAALTYIRMFCGIPSEIDALSVNVTQILSDANAVLDKFEKLTGQNLYSKVECNPFERNGKTVWSLVLTRNKNNESV